MDVRCPKCGSPNRFPDADLRPANPTRACAACGAPLPSPAVNATATIARQRLMDDSPLPRLPLKPAAPIWPPDGLCALPSGPSRPLPTAPPAVLPRPRVEPFPVRRATPVPRGTRRPRSLLASLVWLLGALALLAAAGAQVVWQRPDLLDLLPELRTTAERVCAELGCTLPKPSDPGALGVQASSLGPLEGVPGVSSLRVAVVNRAAYPQSRPGLRLTLVDVADRVVAQRVFRPEEYLPDLAESVAPGAQLDVHMAIEAPETEFAGYRVDLTLR